MNVRCNQCMSVFEEDWLAVNCTTNDVDIEDAEKCPVCGRKGYLMDVPSDEFPQYYEDRPIDQQQYDKAVQMVKDYFDSLTLETFSEVLEGLNGLGHLMPDGRLMVDVGDIAMVKLDIDREKETINIVRR